MTRLPRSRLRRLAELDTSVRRLAAERDAALRIFDGARRAATADTQRELWLEFACLHAEYCTAVQQLADECRTLDRAGRAPGAPVNVIHLYPV